ncbi:MAG: SDR family NAD(P)-dependent oxidoreductase [Mycobacterium sp.]
MSGLVASPGSVSYTATKHAVVGISKALRVEAERHGVQVSVLCPGAIRTPALTGGKFGRIPGISDEELLKSWEGTRRIRRARPSCRVEGRRNHCGADVVEGILIPGAALASVVDAIDKGSAQANP